MLAKFAGLKSFTVDYSDWGMKYILGAFQSICCGRLWVHGTFYPFVYLTFIITSLTIAKIAGITEFGTTRTFSTALRTYGLVTFTMTLLKSAHSCARG